MIKSMTGFGRFEVSEDERKFIVEIRSVNHKYLDVNIRTPGKLHFFEPPIRNLLKKYVKRGKIDIFVTYEDLSKNKTLLKYNETLATEYVGYLEQMAKQFSLSPDYSVTALSNFPDVLKMEEQETDKELLWECLKETLTSACELFVKTREVEGENLKHSIKQKLQEMFDLVSYIESRGPDILTEYRCKLEAKIKELLEAVKVEESRIASEIVIFADKICTDEESVRLKCHIKNMLDTLEEADGMGRKLDFIAQEMNREANTILSKANDMQVSNCAIDLKTKVEQIREQIQNIE